jgi:hypothetical protein
MCFPSSIGRRIWLRHCTTSREDTGLITHGFVGIFYLYNTFSPTKTWDRIRLQPNWIPAIFPRGKGDWCVGMTTFPVSHADCPEIWDSQTPRNLWVCNRNVLVIFYLTISSMAHFLLTNGSQIWLYGPWEGQANFLRGQNYFWVGHRNFTAGIKYFKFKTEPNFHSPLQPLHYKR